jgi:hypothetical protein
MEVEGTVRAEGFAPWAGDPGLNIGKPGAVPGQSRPGHPSGAQTPREALSFIEVLYKAGRMEDLAGLLRQSKVFREAWLMIQRSSPAGWRPGGEVNGSSNRGATLDAAPGPVVSPGTPGQTMEAPPASLVLQAAAPGFGLNSAAANLNSKTAATLLADGRSRRLHAMALQAYQSQEGQYTQDRAFGPRLSLRV